MNIKNKKIKQIKLQNNQDELTKLQNKPITDKDHNLTKQLFCDQIGSDKGGLSKDYQLIVNAEQGSIYIILFHERKVALFLTARLLKEVCKDIRAEPQLQQLTSETPQSTTFTGTKVHLDICASGFWQMTFFHVRVFNPNAKR